MNSIQDLRVFSEIVKSNSFSLAAAKLGLSPATMSGRLKALEDYFGVALLKRTTRSLSLTEEGRFLFETSQAILQDFEILDKTMRAKKGRVLGTITIACPSEFGRKYLLPLTNEFGRANPQIGFRLIFGEDVNVVDDECDVLIKFGSIPDSSLTTRKLGENPVVTCASPEYLTSRGVPSRPEELATHNCLVFLDGRTSYDRWMYNVDGETASVRVGGNRLVSDWSSLIELACDGHGIIRASSWDVARELEDGRLTPVLTEFEREPDIIHLLSEPRHRLPGRTLEFIDFLMQRVKRMSRSVEFARSGTLKLRGAA